MAIPIEQSIREEAQRLGFVACGFTAAEADPRIAERLSEWIAEGHHTGLRDPQPNPGHPRFRSSLSIAICMALATMKSEAVISGSP